MNAETDVPSSAEAAVCKNLLTLVMESVKAIQISTFKVAVT
ncbi:MAG: hypothetical protein ACPL1K_05285 [Candidatus Kryptoniota bacterium]